MNSGVQDLFFKTIFLLLAINFVLSQHIKTGNYSCKKDLRVTKDLLETKCIQGPLERDNEDVARRMQIRCASICLRHLSCEAFSVGFVANGSCILCELTTAEAQVEEEKSIIHCGIVVISTTTVTTPTTTTESTTITTPTTTIESTTITTPTTTTESTIITTSTTPTTTARTTTLDVTTKLSETTKGNAEETGGEDDECSDNSKKNNGQGKGNSKKNKCDEKNKEEKEKSNNGKGNNKG